MSEQPANSVPLSGPVENLVANIIAVLGGHGAVLIEPQVAELAITSLCPADSPRLDGVNESHAQRLTAVQEPLPPILVHRQTLTVIDGAHRIRAAQILGNKKIPVRFVDADYETAFMIGVALNGRHGLQLSLADREAAAVRIVAAHPTLSDRTIAKIVGLSPRTIAKIRRCSTGDNAQLTARVGQDGRVRPLDASAGRQRVIEAIANQPTASLRKIAAMAGVSPATARSVRERLGRGEDPTAPHRPRRNGRSIAANKQLSAHALVLEPETNRPALLAALARDPALRYSENGRFLLRWLAGRLAGLGDYDDLYDKIPAHCTDLVARLALQSASWWVGLYDHMQDRDCG